LCGRPNWIKVADPDVHLVQNHRSASYHPPRTGCQHVPVFLSEISAVWHMTPLDIYIGIDPVVRALFFGQRGFMRVWRKASLFLSVTLGMSTYIFQWHWKW
jgi:hypothetical protein